MYDLQLKLTKLQYALQLMEWLVKLKDYGNKRNHAFFQTIVVPCLSHAEIARNDIISICDEIEKAVTTNVPHKSITDRFIIIGRTARGSRDFLRSAVEDSHAKLTDFERGIQKMFDGGSGHAIIRLHANIHHLAKLIADNMADHKMVETLKERQLSALNQTRENTEDAWKMICAGYMAYSKKYIARPA